MKHAVFSLYSHEANRLQVKYVHHKANFDFNSGVAVLFANKWLNNTI